MYISFLYFLWLSVSGGVHDKPSITDLLQAVDNNALHQQRQLLQYDDIRMSRLEVVQMSMEGCDSSITDCSVAPAPAPTPTPTKQDECVDTAPEGPLECSDYKQKGLCDRLQKTQCAVSCGYCCFDEEPGDVVSCDEVPQLDLCEKVLQDGRCKKTCGACSTADDQQDVTAGKSFAPKDYKNQPYDPWDAVRVTVGNSPPPTPPPPPSENSPYDPWDAVSVTVGNSPPPTPPPTLPPPLPPSPPPPLPRTPPPPLAPTLNEEEANALLAFKNSMQDSFQLSSWIGQNACENWDGIYCENNRVTEIQLGQYSWNIANQLVWQRVSPLVQNAQTSIPSQWSVMNYLQKIQLSAIDLTGFLPVELSQLQSLQVLDVGDGSIEGTLPVEYSLLAELKSFLISFNQFVEGTLPVEYSLLSELQYFDIRGNQLTGTLPDQYSTLISVKNFQVGFNTLTGTLPSSYSTLASLEYFFLNFNSFTGSIPLEYSIFSDQETKFFPQVNDQLCLDGNLDDSLGDDETVYC